MQPNRHNCVIVAQNYNKFSLFRFFVEINLFSLRLFSSLAQQLISQTQKNYNPFSMKKTIFLSLTFCGFIAFAGFRYQQQQAYHHIYVEHSQNLAQSYLPADRAVAQNNSEMVGIFNPAQLQSLDFTQQQQPNQALALLNPEHETGDFRSDFLLGMNFLQKNDKYLIMNDL